MQFGFALLLQLYDALQTRISFQYNRLILVGPSYIYYGNLYTILRNEC